MLSTSESSFATTVRILAILLLYCASSTTYAQNKTTSGDPVAIEETDLEKAKSEIQKLVRAGKIDDAAAKAEEYAEAHPQNIQMQNLRNNVALYMVGNDTEVAVENLLKSVNYNFEAIEKSPSDQEVRDALARSVSTTLATLSMAKRNEEVQPMFEKALAYFPANTGAFSQTDANRSEIIRSFSMFLIFTEGEKEKAMEWITQELARIDQLLELEDRDDERTAYAIRTLSPYARFLKPEERETRLKRIEPAVELAFQENPANKVIFDASYTLLMMKVGGLKDKPNEVEALVSKARSRFEDAAAADESLAVKSKQLTSALDRLMKGMSKDSLRERLVGKPMFKLNEESWVNVDDDAHPTMSDLKGKVVLLDFWAIWCGPCIKNFPHLIEFHDEFESKGLRIVGVTGLHGYKWDDEKDRAVRSTDVPPEQELEALEKFIDQHKLPFPSAVTNEERTIFSDYCVSGIPQAVLIDRKGIVRLINVGSGEKNAKELHELIEKLINEEE